MGRPRTISNEQIIDAARALFIKNGFRVSTAEIARAAGVSEGSIFKRFPTKAKLFEAAMGIPEFDIEAALEGRIGEGEAKENLAEIMIELIDFFRKLLPRTMMAWAHPKNRPLDHFMDTRRTAALTILRGITHFFEEEIKRGRIQDADPEIAARMVLGSIYNYVFFELVGVHVRMPIASETYVRSLIDILWKGMAPRS